MITGNMDGAMREPTVEEIKAHPTILGGLTSLLLEIQSQEKYKLERVDGKRQEELQKAGYRYQELERRLQDHIDVLQKIPAYQEAEKRLRDILNYNYQKRENPLEEAERWIEKIVAERKLQAELERMVKQKAYEDGRKKSEDEQK